MKTFKKVVSILSVFALVLACLAGCGNNAGYTEANTEFVIGMSGPLTGQAATYGIAVKNGADLAVKEINEAGGIDGMKFKLVATDDMHDATKVSTNYSSLFEGGMQVSLGCVTSAPCQEFANLSYDDNVFFLTPSASNDDVPKLENAYQMCFADGNQGKAGADYVNDNFKGQTIGIFYKSDDNYSQGIYKQFKENLDASIKTVDSVFTDANTSDFSSQIDSLKDCKFIFMPIYYTPASLFMKQAKDVISKDAVYYGCDGFDGIDSSIEGFDINTIPQEISMLSHFNSKATDGIAKEFIDKYVSAYDADTLNQFGASAYDCVYAIYNAMKAAYEADKDSIKVTMSASDLCEVLKGQFQGGFSFTGVTGKDITWDATGYVNKTAIKYTIKEANAQ